MDPGTGSNGFWKPIMRRYKAGEIIRVSEGSSDSDSSYELMTDGLIVPQITPLTWRKHDSNLNVRTIAADDNITTNDDTVDLDTSSQEVRATLPTADPGKPIYVSRNGGTNNGIIDGNGNTINGETEVILENPYASVMLVRVSAGEWRQY